VWKQNQDLLDRLSALSGTLPAVIEAAQIRSDMVAAGAESVGMNPDPQDPEDHQAEHVDWQESEIARAELAVRQHGGVVRADFPR
jgi:hypothetical protein